MYFKFDSPNVTNEDIRKRTDGALLYNKAVEVKRSWICKQSFRHNTK